MKDGTKLSYSLGSHSTVFQAEVSAIMCDRICFEVCYRSRAIVVSSDSQAALKGLLKSEVTSKVVSECYSVLCELAIYNKVTLFSVSGHSGILGNEMADELARNWSGTPFTGPEPALGISKKLFKGIVFDIFRNRQYHNWRSIKGQREVKELI